MLKRNSPCDASATPHEIITTIIANFLLGSAMRNVHEMSRMATGVNAWMYTFELWKAQMMKNKMNLEHLNVGYAEIEVGGVTQDQRGAEQKSDGQDRPQENIFSNVYVLRTVNEVGCPLKHSRADSLQVMNCQ